MNWLKLRSMKLKLYLLVAGIMFPLLLGSFISFQRFYAHAQQNTEVFFQQYALSLSESIAQQFWEEYYDIQSITSSINLTTLTPQELQNRLNDEASRHNDWDLMILVDAKGNFLASNSIDSRGKTINISNLKNANFANEQWFKNAFTGNFSEDSQRQLKGTFVEDFILDPVSKLAFSEDRAVSSFSAPIKNPGGQIVGVLTNRVSTNWFERSAKKLYEQIQTTYPSSEITIINKNGFVILDYDPHFHKSPEVIHDFSNVLLKLNLAEMEVEAAQLLNAGKTGHTTSNHARKKINQISGFASIRHEKFLESLGWGVLVRESEEEALKSVINLTWLSLGIFSLIAILASIGSVWYANGLARSISAITDQVATASTQVAAASEQLTTSSVKLSNTSQHQAASIEESSSSLNEIASMIESNITSAESANQVAKEVNILTSETQQWMADLSGAMKSINDSNLRISDLVKIIEGIAEKTEVIDDIVFKTQLLSFNASVEAERAGEHGRGFAVVAQEVGNLAQMSGRAATEIASIVKNSIREAETVARENKARVERGEVLTQETQIKLEAVIHRMTEILGSTNRIMLASKEQGHGITEISSNVEGLNKATQETASTAEQSASSSAQLAAQSETLLALVQQMKILIAGETHSATKKELRTEAFPLHRFKKVTPLARKNYPTEQGWRKPSKNGSSEELEQRDQLWEKLG